GGKAACMQRNLMRQHTISNLGESAIFAISTSSHGQRSSPISAAVHGLLNMRGTQLSYFKQIQGAFTSARARLEWDWPSCLACRPIVTPISFVFFLRSKCS